MYTGMGDDGTQGTVAIERGMLGDSEGGAFCPNKNSLNLEKKGIKGTIEWDGFCF